LTEPELVVVRLLGLSVPAFQHSSEHHDELFREFRLILAREQSPGHTVPARLLELIDELDGRFSNFTAGTQQELDDAVAAGAESIDLLFRVPVEVKAACQRLLELLAEADTYCRHGDLLTLAPPPEAVRFRDWYLEEFVSQVDGNPPVPWPEVAKAG
jgi:hypothetical protein